MSALAGAMETLRKVQPLRVRGVVSALRGLTVLVEELPLPIGSLVEIGPASRGPARAGRQDPGEAVPCRGEVVGFTRDQAIVMTLGQTTGIRPGDAVWGLQSHQTAPVGRALLGRVVDGLGAPMDGGRTLRNTQPRSLSPDPISPLTRRRITRQLLTGVRAIDLFTPLGRGQRIGIFAGPGVGKSTLLGQISRRTSADVNVIALIGERGREVKEFIEHSLGPEGLARSVVIAATGDESPLMRLRAARLACTAAEYFRDEGMDVLLVMDSITRFAHAQRQVGLSVGEPPATKGYTPSVFAQMALLLERAGAVGIEEVTKGRSDAVTKSEEKARINPSGIDTPSLRHSVTPSLPGSITGLYTILVEGDDMTEPVADAARGILDGHIVLSRTLANKGHFPAIDVMDSVSRVSDDVADLDHLDARRRVVRLIALFREVEDLVQIGAYARGSNPETDVAIDMQSAINDLLRQGKGAAQRFEDSRAALLKLAAQAVETTAKLQRARRA